MNSETQTEDTRKCPYCAELIKSDAIKCKHCGSMLDGSAGSSSNASQPESKPATKSRRGLTLGFILMALVLGVVYFTTGFFVIQPIGAVPKGATIWYWRTSTNYPFISSADGLLEERVGKISILGRVVALGAVSKSIGDKKIAVLPYSKTLYLISTGGKEFEK